MASIELRNEPATLLHYLTNGTAGGQIALRVKSPGPPGARLDAVARDDEGVASAFRVKVHRCKKMEDGTFVMIGATQELRREGRAILEGMAAGAPGIPPGL
ncbi:MAG: hypothetical protein ACXWUG_24755 [Polyangiales bacterium]